MEKRKQKIGLFLALPILLGTLVFYMVPLLITIWYSFTFGAGGTNFVGFANYQRVWANQRFQLALINTIKFLGIGVPSILILSLGLALVLNRTFLGNSFFKLSFLFPMMVPISSIVMTVQFLFQDFGICNQLLQAMGLPTQRWLNSSWAFMLLLLLYIWKNAGYNIILLLSGLKMIPEDYYHHADLEGANRWQKLHYITLPMLTPYLFFSLVISVLNSFKSFREAFLLSGNSPHDSIYLLQYFINNNFENLNYPRLSVASVIFFSAILIAVLLLFILQQRKRDDIYV